MSVFLFCFREAKYLNAATDNVIIISKKAGTVYKGVEFNLLGFSIFIDDNLLFEFDLNLFSIID